MADCIFCKIVAGELPCTKVYEDEHCLAFKDLYPRAEVHLLVVPKKHIESLTDIQEEDIPVMGHITYKLQHIAEEAGLTDGFRTIVNTGPGGGQEVYHVHYHILGGKGLKPFHNG